MKARILVVAGVVISALVGACSDPNPGNDTSVRTDFSTCTAATSVAVALQPGQFQIVDATNQGNCLRLPAGNAATEYAVVAYSGFGVSSANGTSADFDLQSLRDSVLAPVTTSTLGTGLHVPGMTAAPVNATRASFDRHLRTLERSLAANPERHFSRLVTPPLAVPTVGTHDSFFVCATGSCATFKKIGATVRYAGQPALIYVDDQQVAGAGTYTDADLQQMGTLFDSYLYPTDTTAFGRESDINGDGHIAILMTPAVNNLTTDCTDGRVFGYTFGNDLLPFATGSNAREMFYAIVPSVAAGNCQAITHDHAVQSLQSTLIHEMQHMISFNQHVLVRDGNDQDVWMNEGLSHFAEELGWRTVPAAQCTTFVGNDCFSDFTSGDVLNAYSYLTDPESTFLIAPEAGDGTLDERGAAWLFIRWVADHYSADSLLGTQFTRGMEQSTVLGADRVAQLAGASFPTLVGMWQLSNYVSNLPLFPSNPALTYRTWNFRDLYANLYVNSEVSLPYPLVPDSTLIGTYTHLGTLRAGSGHTVRYLIPAGGEAVTVRLAGTTGDGSAPGLIIPYLAVVRIK